MRNRGRRSASPWTLTLIIGSGVLVAVIALGFLVIGVGRPLDRRSTVGRPVPEPASPPRRAPAARINPEPMDLPVVVVRPVDHERFTTERPVDGLRPDSVVQVAAIGFEAFELGRVEQCVSELGRLAACGRPFPVQFGEDGRADFQYRVRNAFAPGGCRSGRATCLLRVSGDGSGLRGETQTVFIDRLTPASIGVEPSSGLAVVEAASVTVSGFPPGLPVTALLCLPPGTYDVRRCGPPGPSATFKVGPDGAGSGELTVKGGPLGTDLVPCDHRQPCAVAVLSGDGFAAAASIPVTFSLGPGASYDPQRLSVGLTAAVLLGLVALLVARRTDWTKPAEAATPEADAADLRAGASLDDLFGTDAQLEARDPMPF